MIIREDKIFFIHIPKTAGTSIEHAINGKDNPLWARHYNYSQFSLYPKKYNPREYYIFTVVRNPWDRIYSCFLWSKYKAKSTNFWCETFEEYLKFIELQDIENSQTYSLINDFNWWTGGIQNLNHVARFENLESDLIPIKEYLGKDFVIAHTNTNPIRDPKISYKSEYNSYGVDLIKEKYKQEIELFDYSF
jgi:hypothetical protein